MRASRALVIRSCCKLSEVAVDRERCVIAEALLLVDRGLLRRGCDPRGANVTVNPTRYLRFLHPGGFGAVNFSQGVHFGTNSGNYICSTEAFRSEEHTS